MWNKPQKAQLKTVPALYQTEEMPLKDKTIYFHFFIGNCDWYVSEFDGEDTFWGFVILNNDFQMAEWGYFSFGELANIRIKGIFEIENDTSWQIRQAHQIERICQAQGWTIPDFGVLEIECPGCKKTISSYSVNSEIHCPECKVIILQKCIAHLGGRNGLYS